jgi:hypothetical protein
MIIAIAFRLSTFNSIGFTTNPTLLQDEFIIWTQTELAFSIIAATIPSVRPFIKTLATNYGTAAPNATRMYGSSGGNGYMRSNGENETVTEGDIQLSDLRPKGDGSDEYKFRIWSAQSGANTGKPGAGKNGDSSSVGSSESKRMIIKKHLDWEVNSETR